MKRTTISVVVDTPKGSTRPWSTRRTLDQSQLLDRLTRLQIQQKRSTVVHHWKTLQKDDKA